jgi:hypothetical protein
MNGASDHAGDARDQIAAVDVEAVGKHEDGAQVRADELAAERFSGTPRESGSGDVFGGESQPCRSERQRDRCNLVVEDFVVADLAAGAASDDMGFRKSFVEFEVALLIFKVAARPEVEHELNMFRIVGAGGPARPLSPRQKVRTHASLLGR